MKSEQLAVELLAEGLLVIARGFTREGIARLADGLSQAGIRFLEVTLEANGLDILRWLAATHGDRMQVGAGTVLTPDQAGRAVAAGARYLVSPGFFPDVAEAARETGVLYIPGVTTSTEVGLALRAGLPLLKLFPAGLLGPDYLRALRGPYPQLKAVAVGNMTFERMEPMLRAGAAVIALGSSVFGRGERELSVEAIAEAGRRASAIISVVRAEQKAVERVVPWELS